jgi:hypothetical protein
MHYVLATRWRVVTTESWTRTNFLNDLVEQKKFINVTITSTRIPDCVAGTCGVGSVHCT